MTPETEALRFIREVVLTFDTARKFIGKAFIVGGATRDRILSQECKDIDIVVEIDGGSEEFAKEIHSHDPIAISTPRQMGENYPIFQITFKENIPMFGNFFETKGAILEFADTMSEEFPDENSRQRVTKFGTIHDDIKRRDLTCNMGLIDIATDQIIDLTGVTVSDIKKGILRGHPEVSMDMILAQDPLRLVRICRFFAKFEWSIPMDVLKSMRRNAHRIKIVSIERVMEELVKVMEIGKLERAIRLMHATGILIHILPEIEEMFNVKQGTKWHKEGCVFKHTMNVLKHTKPGVIPQLAACLHDAGKQVTQEIISDEIIHFKGHDLVGGIVAKKILRRLKFDNHTIDTVSTLVRNHMRIHNVDEMGVKGIRKLIRDMGENLNDLIDLGEADSLGSIPLQGDVKSVRNKINEVLNSKIPVVKRSILNGEEIMKALNMTKGSPIIHDAMQFLINMEDDMAEKGMMLTKEIAIKELQSNF